jgi:hypothetical protein
MTPDPYPFNQIPPPGTPVTDVRLFDSLYPLLLGMHSQTLAFAHACRAADAPLTGAELFHGLTQLAGQAALACELLTRWSHDAEGLKAPPPLRTPGGDKGGKA